MVARCTERGDDVRAGDAKLVAEYLRQRGVTQCAPSKARPQALRVVKGPRRASRTGR